MGTILMREWIEARRRILCYGSWTPGCAADLIVPGISGTREEICSVIAFPGSGRTVTDSGRDMSCANTHSFRFG